MTRNGPHLAGSYQHLDRVVAAFLQRRREAE